MDYHVAAGLDVGYRKTGITIFHMTKFGAKLVAAKTIKADDNSCSSSLLADLSDCWQMQERILEYLKEHQATAIFAEFPGGGSQSGRAARCMGMATAICAGIFYGEGYSFEIMVPLQIEKALGFYISNQEKTKLKLSKGDLRKRRKELLKKYVVERFPDFEGWPDRAAEAEDAYDSAAAFLAGEHAGPEGLYLRLINSLK